MLTALDYLIFIYFLKKTIFVNQPYFCAKLTVPVSYGFVVATLMHSYFVLQSDATHFTVSFRFNQFMSYMCCRVNGKKH